MEPSDYPAIRAGSLHDAAGIHPGACTYLPHKEAVAESGVEIEV